MHIRNYTRVLEYALDSQIIRQVLECVCVEREDEREEGDEVLSYHCEKPAEKITWFSEQMNQNSKELQKKKEKKKAT